MEPVRLQRFLAQAGVTSRRKAEELIVKGLVRVNGKVVTELGTKVDPARDRVAVENRPVEPEAHVYVLMHKPKGTVTTLDDPDKRPTVMQLLDRERRQVRLYPVGRLDFNTEGVLLLTNDGELAHALMHPSRSVEKTYHVKLRGTPTQASLEELRSGIELDDGETTQPAEVTLIAPSEGGRNTWLEVTLHEGKNRQIHRMMEAIGHQVAKLHRVAYAGLTVEELPPGRSRDLTPKEVARLRKLAGLEKEASGFRPRAPAGKHESRPAPPKRKRTQRRRRS